MSEERNDNKPEYMMSDLLAAISENEYPDYILEAIEKVRAWIDGAISHQDSEDDSETDEFMEIFGHEFEDDDDDGNMEDLFGELRGLSKYADVIPNASKSNGKADTIIVSLAPPDYDSGLRTAIDCAAIFNRPNCKRVWILSDTFIFNEIIKYIPHVDALGEQGITLRFILITPWGWVELPLSAATVTKRQFLWRTDVAANTTKNAKITKKDSKAKRRKRN